jgi:hypothetical protein
MDDSQYSSAAAIRSCDWIFRDIHWSPRGSTGVRMEDEGGVASSLMTNSGTSNTGVQRVMDGVGSIREVQPEAEETDCASAESSRTPNPLCRCSKVANALSIASIRGRAKDMCVL